MTDLNNSLSENEVLMFADFDSLSLDDLNDLPSFEPYPNGAHTVTISFEKKVINEHPAVILHTTYVATQQLEDDTAKPPKAGDTYDFAFMLDNEYGTGSLKKVLAQFAERAGTTSITGIMEAVDGFEALLVTKLRHDKKNDVDRANIVTIEPV